MDAILQFFETIFQLISNFFTNIVWCVTNIPYMMQSIIETFVYIPDFLYQFMYLSVSLTMLFAVIRLL